MSKKPPAMKPAEAKAATRKLATMAQRPKNVPAKKGGRK
jgi:hypothetical protein